MVSRRTPTIRAKSSCLSPSRARCSFIRLRITAQPPALPQFSPGAQQREYHHGQCPAGGAASGQGPVRRGRPQCQHPQRDGGHAEYLLAEEKDLILLPDALSYEDGAFISCGVGTAYEGILRGEVSGSDNALVVGLGPVGMMAMMLAKGRGAKRIIGVDMLPERLAMAKQLGVMDHGYLATTEGLPQIIAELTHGGADVALDCSGNAAGRLLALQSTADWGRVVYIGETGKVEFEVSADLMHHQRRIIGSWVTSLFHMEKCAHDLTDWKLWPRNAITHRFSLEQAGDAYALMASGKCGKVVINFPD